MFVKALLTSKFNNLAVKGSSIIVSLFSSIWRVWAFSITSCTQPSPFNASVLLEGDSIKRTASISAIPFSSSNSTSGNVSAMLIKEIKTYLVL